MKSTFYKFRGSNSDPMLTEGKREKPKKVVENEDTDKEKGKDKDKGENEEWGDYHCIPEETAKDLELTRGRKLVRYRGGQDSKMRTRAPAKTWPAALERRPSWLLRLIVARKRSSGWGCKPFQRSE
jgi:hypothetical protein